MSSQLAVQHSMLMYQRMSTANNSASVTGQAAIAVTVATATAAATSGVTSGAGGVGVSNAASVGSNSTSEAAAATLNALNSSDENFDLINPLFEIALQKAPLLYIKRGDLAMGMRKFRELLVKKNIQSITSIRQSLLRKFAECLIFNVSTTQYLSPYRSSLSEEKSKLLFKPNNRDEEILLCLLLSQYLASKEVMLFRQAQFKPIREYTFANAINSLDLLLFYMSYHRSYNVLIDVGIFDHSLIELVVSINSFLSRLTLTLTILKVVHVLFYFYLYIIGT